MFFFVMLFIHYFFLITKVEIKDSNGNPVNDWQWENVSEIRDHNILLLSESAAESKILRANPAIETVRVVKILPQSVELIVKFRKPVVYLTLSPTRYLLLSSDGTVLDFAYEKPEDLGEIRYYQSISPGEYARGKPLGSRDVRFAAGLAGIFHQYGYSDFLITIEDSHLMHCRVDTMEFIAASDSDHDKQMVSVTQLMKIVQKGGERFKSADVRFEKIIIGK